jgi:hypothetical protein
VAPGDFKSIAGKQRAVLAQPGGHVVVGSSLEHVEAIVFESGTAVLEPFTELNDDLTRWKIRVPIMVVPTGATVVKTVAGVALATIGWNDSADVAVWGSDKVSVEEDTSTRDLFLVVDLAIAGQECGLGRVAYHITIFIQGRKYIADPNAIVELQKA